MNEYPHEVNIARPYPGTGENARIISHIEPLREAGKVVVSQAYWFNLDQHEAGKECSMSPGFKYMFWFNDPDLATAFNTLFGVKNE